MRGIRISLRLLFLLVTLFAVIFATLSIKTNRQARLREIESYELMRAQALVEVSRTTGMERRGWQKSLRGNEAEIEKRQQQLQSFGW